MKFFIGLFFLAVLEISCVSPRLSASGNAETKTIVYFAPHDVEVILEAEAKKIDSIYFELWNEDNSYRIFLHRIDVDVQNPWISRSQRKIYLGGKLFPIVFDYDRVFAVTDNGEEVLRKFSLEKYPLFNKSLVMNHGSYFVKFEKETGKIIQTGYDGLKPK
jgi:hypothetical protein